MDGSRIYFNPAISGGLCTSVSGVLELIDFAAETTVNPSATGKVRLNGNARAAGWELGIFERQLRNVWHVSKSTMGRCGNHACRDGPSPGAA